MEKIYNFPAIKETDIIWGTHIWKRSINKPWKEHFEDYECSICGIEVLEKIEQDSWFSFFHLTCDEMVIKEIIE
jgi:hypothetical protein